MAPGLTFYAGALLCTVWLGLAVGLLSVTLTQGSIFEPLREKVTQPWWQKLVTCPFCMSHWIAAAAVFAWAGVVSAVYPAESAAIPAWAVLVWAGLEWAAITGVGALWAGLIGRVYAGE